MRKLSVFLLLSFFVLGVSAAQAATIRINSPKIELELAPGQTYSGEIIAENPTNEALKTKIYLEDWIYKTGGTGEKIFSPIGTTALSAGRWITFTPTNEEVQPYSRTVVRYTINVPADA